MKKLKVLFSTSLLLLSLSSISMARSEITVLVNENKIYTDVPPQISNNRVLVPIRAVSENMGATVNWNPVDGSATIVSNNINMKLYINSSEAIINGEKLILDQPAIVASDRIMVPIRFISENMGARVNWYDETKTATIDYNRNYKATPYGPNEDYVIRDLNSFIEHYGQPKSEDTVYADDINAYVKRLNYSFGSAGFIPSYNSSSGHILIAIQSKTNLLGAPRDIRIGDTVKYVMDKFPDNKNYEPSVFKTSDNKDPDAKVLYSIKTPFTSMGEVFHDEKGKVVRLEYTVNPFTADSNKVIYRFHQGRVSSIALRYAVR